jgi:hypothetical protein
MQVRNMHFADAFHIFQVGNFFRKTYHNMSIFLILFTYSYCVNHLSRTDNIWSLKNVTIFLVVGEKF